MKLIQRIGYYLIGFSIGLIILAFFFNKKNTSCSYGPNARVLKNINSKKIIYSNISREEMVTNNIDTIDVNYILKKGDIDFSKSDTRKNPCAIYYIEGYYNKKNIFLTVNNCDSLATILNVALKQKAEKF